MSQRTLRACDACDAEIKGWHVSLSAVCDFCAECSRKLTLEAADKIHQQQAQTNQAFGLSGQPGRSGSGNSGQGGFS